MKKSTLEIVFLFTVVFFFIAVMSLTGANFK